VILGYEDDGSQKDYKGVTRYVERPSSWVFSWASW
jgi:hypothetical protein